MSPQVDLQTMLQRNKIGILSLNAKKLINFRIV